MTLFIPWRLFFRFFIKLPVNSREHWLTLFKFDDPGVQLIPDIPISPEVTAKSSPAFGRETGARYRVCARRTEANKTAPLNVSHAAMRITQVKVFPVTGKDDLLGYADIIIDDCICVRDLKIRRETIGFKIAMPQVKLNNGKYKDIAFALNYETRKMIENAVLAGYQKVTAGPS